MARHLVEPASYLLLNYIQANIGTALSSIITSRNTAEGNFGDATPLPRQYFIAKKYGAYQAPAIFIIADEIDFKKERGANFIFATASYGIAAIAEAQDLEKLTRITWRYQAALSQILDNLSLTSADNTFNLTVIVRRAEFSEDYTDSTKPGEMSAIWRKGVKLTCDVEFREQL